MHAAAWTALFRRIPVELHDSLALVTNTTLEILVQSILRLEDDYLILRGRVAGTSDAGRIILVPFDQLTFVGCNKRMMDPEVEALFGAEHFPAPDPEPAQATTEAPPASAPLQEAPAPSALAQAPEPSGNSPTPARPAPVSKSVLLARLRQRLGLSGSDNASVKDQ